MALLEVRALARSFYAVHALNGVDLDAERGTITGLIGPNGAGKTTLFHCVSGLIPPEAGRVRFDGHDITGEPPHRITQRGLVRTFQIARGFPRSFIAPDAFVPLVTIYVVLALTAGGTGNNWGAVLGAGLVVFFLESTRFATAWLPGLCTRAGRRRARVRHRREPDPRPPPATRRPAAGAPAAHRPTRCPDVGAPMSRSARLDPLPHLEAVARAMREAGQPETGCRALDLGMGAVIGHKLFTVLLHHPRAQESERRYTNQPAAFPVGGRKPVSPTAWTERLFVERRPYIGRTAEDIRSVFFDHELIQSLGCASVLNVPVVWDARTLGTVNLLHEAGWYDEADVPVAQVFVALATPLLLELPRG
jgi:ABC-type oligopeptide transport system ATPase subunit